MAMALGDPGGYEHHWLIDPGQRARLRCGTEDRGIDGELPVDLDQVDLVGIPPLPSTWGGHVAPGNINRCVEFHVST